ncbi:GNAT family N-acetyltransferase [Alkalihalobacillus sp. MEB130]|uniref:GNAT family N-acetyltransferase n=1 Tax=Alkalihalobacillus sp. MEB130 TaxID=2976704 RepID=UPI0028DEC14F|nr:GNAT family N-acetyltransferase [Alkalihalobacillus sp. MEB130]MDT8859551.1 GNAT family N-acetyltransferase [Alkalihalobacillus sp. MEB130]
MKIINIGEEKYEEAVRLSEYAFQYTVAEEQVQERIEQMKKHHHLIGIVEEDQLIAKLHFLPLEIFLNGKKIKMGGIAGVATYPEYRRNGYVKGMLTHILKSMREDGYTISMLHPFSVAFYRKFGWELFTDQLTVTMKNTDLKFQQEASEKVQRYSNSVAVSELKAIYEQYGKKFNGMLVRSDDWWKKIVKDKHVAIYTNQAKQLNGYFTYVVKDKKMKVEEFVALNGEARRGLWNYICQHDSMIDELEMILEEREPLLFSLDEPRVKRELTPYFMTRIVDVEAFLHQYRFNWQDDEETVLQITDAYAPWNNQTFLLKDGEITVMNKSQREEKRASTLCLSINALAAILFGYKRPENLMEIGEVSGDDAAIDAFEKLVPHESPFFYDFF